jgi:excisionase family DNA binding protein
MTSRTSSSPRSPTSRAASGTRGTGIRGRPLTRLRKIDETAELLNVSPRTVRRLIESGALPVRRFQGRVVRIADEDLAAFLAASRSV